MTTTATASGVTPVSAASRKPSSTTPDSLAAALALLQARLPHVGKDKTAVVTSQRTGKTHTYDYANLATIGAQVLPLMGELGLSFTACPELSAEKELVLRYCLRHVSGESEGGVFPLAVLLPREPSPQQFGSAITYARRYCFCAVTGVAPDDDDDDAQAAEQAARPKRARSAPLKGAALREHNALRREGQPTVRDVTAGKLEAGIRKADPADSWASVDANGERQPPGDLPVTYPPGDRQFRALAMHFKRLGYDDGDEQGREERLVFTAALAGAGEVSSSRDLTQEQVKLALGRLEKLRDRAALVDAVEALKESEDASA